MRPVTVSCADFTIEPGWLPDGFILADEGQTYTSLYCVYEDKTNSDIDISITKSTLSGGSLAVDTEDAKVTTIMIQNHKTTFIEKENWNCVVIPIPKEDKIVYMNSNGVASDVLKKVAENLPL